MTRPPVNSIIVIHDNMQYKEPFVQRYINETRIRPSRINYAHNLIKGDVAPVARKKGGTSRVKPSVNMRRGFSRPRTCAVLYIFLFFFLSLPLNALSHYRSNGRSESSLCVRS